MSDFDINADLDARQIEAIVDIIEKTNNTFEPFLNQYESGIELDLERSINMVKRVRDDFRDICRYFESYKGSYVDKKST